MSINFLTSIRNILKSSKPIIKENTFIIWEPCSKSHAEVVPGYAKYLLDLGYHVSILMTPDRYKEGLFCRFDSDNISYNQLTQRQIKKFFSTNNLDTVSGVLVTTIGKIYDNDIDSAYKFFSPNIDKSKILFVEHEIDKLADNDTLKESIITLRDMDYKNSVTTAVNPHYFGEIERKDKNSLTNFITIGSLSEKRKSTKLLIDAVEDVVSKGITNFKVTIIGKGKVSSIPTHLRCYFDIKGRLPFDKMYNEIEKSDFILSAYESNEIHRKYITIKTSGAFQLVYGFLKPMIIKREFSHINGFNDGNSILYNEDHTYSNSMIQAINMNQAEYAAMQTKLHSYSSELYSTSKNNLENIIATNKRSLTK